MNWVQKAIAQVFNITFTSPITQSQLPVGSQPVYPRAEMITFINKFSSNASLYIIVSMIARKFASIPRYVYQVTDDSAETMYKRLIGQKGFKLKQATDLHKKAYEETIVTNNPLSELMAHPNDEQNQDMYYEILATYYLLTGNGFQWLNRDWGTINEQEIMAMRDFDTGMSDEEIEKLPIIERHVLPSQYVGLIVRPDQYSPLGGELIGYQVLNNGKPLNLRLSEVLHWKKPNPNFQWVTLDHFMGLSPLYAALKILTQDEAATDASVAMYQNGGARGAIVMNPAGAPGVNANLSPEQLNSIDRSIGDKVNGNWNKGNVSRLPGYWEYLNFGQTSVEMELVDATDKIFVKLCNVYGVNPQVFMTATTFNNVEQARADLITNLVLPMCCSLRDEENEDFLEAFGMSTENAKPGATKYTTDCDVSMLPELQDDQSKLSTSLAASWWLTVNERRMMMEQEELADPNADLILVPNNLLTLEDAAMPPETMTNTPYGQGSTNIANNNGSLSGGNGKQPARSSGS